MTNKYEARQPCKSCPYRKDAPLAYWSEEEFLNLERTENDPMGAVFGCHQDNKKPRDNVGVCIGWLLDQRKRNIPSIHLRLRLAHHEELQLQTKEANADGIPLWKSLTQMVAANLRAIRAQANRIKRRKASRSP